MIHRRGFLASVAGVFGTLFGMKSLPKLAMEAVPAGHLFDWTMPQIGDKAECPSTTDPEWKGKLGYGPHQRVSLDGKDISHLYIRKFFTGLNGWVEHSPRDDKGNIFYTDDGTGIRYETLLGNVKFWVDESITSY